MITIQELLFNRGLSKLSKIKLVRHKDARIDLYDLYQTDKKKFFIYQSQQGRDVFKGVEFLVSFIGEEGTLSRLIGVFKIQKTKKLMQKRKAIDGGMYQYHYDIVEVPGFDDLKERVIIDWGKATINWAQWIDQIKQVVEIQPGLHYQQFKDYFDFVLSFRELKEIVNKQYSDWKRMLSAIKGIYLINDRKTGKLYVGAAYGDEGIWGRWVSYVASNGHGFNKSLVKLVSKNAAYANNFHFSILMILPKTITADQAIEKEKLFKRKLGTNSFGLNNN